MAITNVSGNQDELMRIIVALVRLSGGVAAVSASSLREFEPGDGVLIEQKGDEVTLRVVSKKSKMLWLGTKAAPVEQAEVHMAESPAAAEKPWIITDEVLAQAERAFRGKQ